LFRPIPAERPDRLVGLFGVNRKTGRAGSMAYDDIRDFADQSRIFEGVATHAGVPLNLRTGSGGDLVWGEMVSENYFDVVRLRPVRGRFFPRDVQPGADPFVVLSYDGWVHRFARSDAVVGQTVRINGSPFTIIGVAPRGFRGMRKFGFWPDMWVPLGMRLVIDSTYPVSGRGSGPYDVVARLRDGWTLARTQTAVAAFAGRLADAFPGVDHDRGAVVVAARGGASNPTFSPPAVLVLGASLGEFAVITILLIVCANLGNLLLARGAARQHELAIRLSLGCSRARLVRQLLVEAAVLAAPGILLGGLALLGSDAIAKSQVPRLQFPVGFDVSPDAHVVLYTAAIGLLAIVCAGLAPALRASRPHLRSSLTTVIGERSGAESPRSRAGMRATLVVMQLAMSVVLLVGGGLFVRSLMNARGAELGFDPAQRVALSVNLGLDGYNEARGVAFIRDVLSRVRAMPSVAAASAGFPVPFDTYSRSVSLVIDGTAEAARRQPIGIEASTIEPQFFGTMGIGFRAGRDFDDGDSAGAPLRIIVNQAMARRFWPGRSAIGQQMRFDSITGPPVTVIGVVDDARVISMSAPVDPLAYVPLRQLYTGWMTIVAHTRGDPLGTLAAIRDAIAAADPALPAFGAETMSRSVDNALANEHVAATFAGFFGLAALIIAAVGLYGLVANVVAARTREIGVRVALGATPGRVISLVIGGAGRLAILGLAIGLAGALALGRVLGGLLVGLSPVDPLTFASVPVALAAVVFAASYIPARRATRIDPMHALRH
ncbi:MAG TPA: ABC transporter permease, partial [Gemmatimonadaceae bacterium]|nr:ABC transporter permease [Gemmatimonadaceae bacterium]